MPIFEIPRFIDDCSFALTSGPEAVRELLARTLERPGPVLTALGEREGAGIPEGAGMRVLHRSPGLTVLDFTWAPWMCIGPHNHHIWAVIGIVSGREDNVFWRRAGRSIEAAGAKTLGAGEVVPLGREIIHSVLNPIGKHTRAIHVYGGDFFAPPMPRSQWDHETLTEEQWDPEATKRRFTEAEARYRATMLAER